MSSGAGCSSRHPPCRLLASCSRDDRSLGAGWCALEGVPSAYAAARDGIDAMLRDRGLRRTSPGDDRRVAAARRPRAARCSRARRSTLEEVRDGRRATRSPPTRSGCRPSCWRWRPLLTPLAAPGARPAPHARGRPVLAADDELGRPARRGVRRPAAAASPSCCSPTTAAPALLVAAVVHAELATAAPFASHNGLVARAAERLVLVARGVDAKSLVVPGGRAPGAAPGVRVEPAALPRRRCSGASTRWLLYAAEAYAAGRRGAARCGGPRTSRRADMRAAPDSRDSGAAADT